MKSLIGLKDVDGVEIKEIIDLAIKIKNNQSAYADVLKNKTLVMIFQKTSTRTRVSFEAGMTQLGGHAQYLDWRTTNFTLGDTKDEIKCLDRYADIIMARVYKHDDIVQMADASRVPVINGLCDLEHPCQTLADLMTIKEKFGSFKNLTVAYVGDGNNVCNSLIIGCAKLGIKINVATPEKYKPAEFAVKIGNELGMLKLTTDPKEAVMGANVVYTDTWVSMGDEAQKEERIKVFSTYQVTSELMKATNNAYFMHCLPAHRGYEVSDEVLDSNKSIVYDQAENRMHVQKAVILYLIGNK